ncbi:MAG: lycopene cyclase family protein [Bacteroidota bacterium]
MSNNSSSYDFIVAGAGAAGRSFVYHLLQTPLRDSRILLLDRDPKNTEDRTWCFWEAEEGPFQRIVHHQWRHLWFHNQQFSRELDIDPFRYKMIRSLDFYQYTDRVFAQFPNVVHQRADISAIQQATDKVKVRTTDHVYEGRWCLDSLPTVKIDKEKSHYLDQHFRGWFIRTERAAFDPTVATLMDFRVPQGGDFRFVYVMPTSPHEALVEYTLFSNEHLTTAQYDAGIHDYLTQFCPKIGPYEVVRTEQGNIPMTDFQFPNGTERILKVGAAGGDTRASTGYTFVNIHRRVGAIVRALVNNQPIPAPSFSRQRHQLYDSLMLRVLQHQRYPGDQLFGQLFEKNPPKRLLRFLNGESHLGEEIALMSTTPIPVFLRVLGEKMLGAIN